LPDVIGLINGDADKLQAFGAVCSLKANEIAHLVPARGTPSGPEVNDQDLAAPLVESLFPSFIVGQGNGEQSGSVGGGCP
jgi:hypothetical protein